MSIERVVLPRSTVAPVQKGHPWVYGDVRVRSDVGAPVELVTDGGDTVGWGIVDQGAIRVRVLGRAGAESIPRVIAERIQRAHGMRLRMMDPTTDCYRVVNGAGDGLPGMVLDRYGPVAVLRIYASAWVPHVDTIVRAVMGLGWVSSLVRKLGVTLVDGSSGLEHLAGDEAPHELVVSEGGMQLLVQPGVGQKTGMFLDQREHRALVGRWAAGRVVANLFSYHGGFSVAAALGGAAMVTTVDIAPEAIADARRNFELNGLDPRAHQFEVADAFTWKPKGKVDLLIVDPPSLAKGKRSLGAAKSAYRKLHRRLANSVAKDGLLATASCTARLDRETWMAAVTSGLEDAGSWSWLHTSTAPIDHPVAVGHPEGEYLKFGLLRRR